MNIHTRYSKMLVLTSLLTVVAFHNIAQASPFGRNPQVRPLINKNDDYKRLMGLTAGAGKIKTENDLEDGVSLYANAFMFWFNFSIEYQHFDTRTVANTYTGLGMGRYLQIQYGYGDEGYVVRARSEFEVVGRFTVFIARERYRDNPVFDNYSMGIGYNF